MKKGRRACLGGPRLLGVKRIDHGNRSLEDHSRVARLAGERMALTVCPLSNLRLRVIHEFIHHPLRRMMDKGLLVTVNWTIRLIPAATSATISALSPARRRSRARRSRLSP